MYQPIRFGPTGLIRPGQFPQAQGLRINWTHPLARGLASCVVADAGTLVDLAFPARGPAPNTGLVGQGPTTSRGATASSVWSDTQSTDLNITSGSFSIAGWGYVGSAVANYPPLIRSVYTDETHGSGYSIFARWHAGTDYVACFEVQNNNGVANSLCEGTTLLTPNSSHMVGGTSDGTTRTVYADGVAEGTTTNNPSPATYAGTFYYGQRTHIGCIWIGRVLSADDMKLFYDDPFCFIQPQVPFGIVKSAAGFFAPSLLNGLGAGGPFFNNRLG